MSDAKAGRVSGRGGGPRARFSRRLLGGLPLLLLAALALLILAAPALVAAAPNAIHLQQRLLAPGHGSLLGTDALGRDELSRLLSGGRTALLVGGATVLLSSALAAALGLLAGFAGGAVDLLVSALLDLMLTLPGLLITLALLGVLGTGRAALVVAMANAFWAGHARILRGQSAVVGASPYVDAARALGAGRLRLLRQHVLPSVLPSVCVLASLALGEVLLIESALSFLGLGAQPPASDWGTMLADSRPYLSSTPSLMLAPGVCIVLFSLLANLSGDTLRDLLDPRRRHARRGAL